jgi:hypothetical protein
MAAERQPGSNSGRASINWDEAFLFYAALPADRRSYQAVADEFGPSVRTVERHGRNDKWNEKARQLDKAASAAVAAQIRDQRAEKLLDVLRLIDATTVIYANQLRDDKVKVSPRDLATLHKLRTEVWAETDTTFAEASEPTATADPVDSSKRKLQVLRALHEAGVLQELLDLDAHGHANDNQSENERRGDPDQRNDLHCDDESAQGRLV